MESPSTSQKETTRGRRIALLALILMSLGIRRMRALGERPAMEGGVGAVSEDRLLVQRCHTFEAVVSSDAVCPCGAGIREHGLAFDCPTPMFVLLFRCRARRASTTHLDQGLRPSLALTWPLAESPSQRTSGLR